MPYPEKVEVKTGKFKVDKNFKLKITGKPNNRIYAYATRVLMRLSNRTGLFFSQGVIKPNDTTTSINFTINCKTSGKVQLNENESYKLMISGEKIELSAENDLGAIRGMETLLQLLANDKDGYYFPALEITDSPRFPWRGLMIDVSRHFMPVDVIKRNIDGMALVKMNVLHLHLCDDQGFRIESKTFPKLHELGSNGQYFTQVQIKDIINYADERGIRVVPEFDMPGHATSWFPAYPELASAKKDYSIETGFGVFDPTMDPTKPSTYTFLAAFIKEMAQLFPDEYFHIGGDENNGKQWNENADIQKFKTAKGFKTNHELQSYFNRELLKTLTQCKKKMMGWDEIFQPELPKSIVIQSWRGKEYMVKAAKQGYQTILSNGYYIDLCQNTDFHYNNDPVPTDAGLTAEESKYILGGECTMWAELVTPETVDSRIWNRSAAIAERFWSPQSVKDVNEMHRRLEIISIQLEEVGLLHIKNRDMMMRRLLGSDDISALKTFVNAIEPVKGYKRHSVGYKFTTASPFSRIADIAIPDAPNVRKFANAVETYLVTKDDLLKRAIFAQLVIWTECYKKLKPQIDKTPVLKEIEEHIKDFDILAKIALDALFLIDKNSKTTVEWRNSSLENIERIKKAKYETELNILPAIEKMVLKLELQN